jgi:hypothetical protein
VGDRESFHILVALTLGGMLVSFLWRRDLLANEITSSALRRLRPTTIYHKPAIDFSGMIR